MGSRDKSQHERDRSEWVGAQARLGTWHEAQEERPALAEAWTPKFVGKELVEALRWAEASAGATGPARMRSAALGFFASDELRAFEGWPAIHELDPPKAARLIRPARVSQFERIIWWPGTHLAGLPGPARVLHVWLRCKISRKAKFDDACDRMGWPRSTAYRARDKALAAIAQGLTAAGIAKGKH